MEAAPHMTLDHRVKPEDDEAAGEDDELGAANDGEWVGEEEVVEDEVKHPTVIPVLVTGIHAAPLSA